MTLASVKIQFFFQHYFSPTEVPHEHPVPQGHSQCHPGPRFHFLMNVALTRLQLNKWSQDTSNLEALSIKVAYKCKIVHIPGDVWKSYYCHAGEMNNPKKLPAANRIPRYSVCANWVLGAPVHEAVNLAPLPVNGVKEKWVSSRERVREGDPPGEGSLEAFMTESLIGK